MKKNNLIIYISCVVVVVAVIFAMLTDTIGPILSSLITTVITTFGAVLIWIQLKKNSIKISSELILNMNNILLKAPGLVYLRDKLKRTCNPDDFTLDGKIGNKDTTKDLDNFMFDDSINIIEYLEFFENIGVMYFSGSVSMKDLDNCFGETFFVAMNNKYIQDREIIPYKEHYSNIIKLYGQWFKYRQKHKIVSPYNETPLDYITLLEGLNEKAYK